MRVYFVHLPKKKDVYKGIHTVSKYGSIALTTLFFAGYPKSIIITASVVNSVITVITEQMGKK
jgi:hypothetical protein